MNYTIGRRISPIYTISLVTTSTSYRTRGFLIMENICSSSSVEPLAISQTPGDVGPVCTYAGASGLCLGLTVPICDSYSSNLDAERLVLARCSPRLVSIRLNQ